MASNLKLANNAVARLSVALSASTAAVTVVVAPGQGVLFPAISGSQYFPATLIRSDGAKEIVKVTARNTDTFTVVRAQETTVALAFAVNDFFELRVTAGALQGELDAMSNALATKADASALAGKQDALGFAPYNSSNPAGYITASEAATQFVDVAGDTMGGPLIFPNNVPIRMKDTANNARVFAQVSSANNVQLVNIGGNNWQILNQVVDTVILNLNNSGDLTIRSWTTTSDETLKTNRRPFNEAMLDIVADMVDAGYFDWKDGTGTALGLSAQELQKIGLGVVVKTDAEGKMSVDYAGLTAVLVHAMLRREKRRHAEYEARFAALEAK